MSSLPQAKINEEYMAENLLKAKSMQEHVIAVLLGCPAPQSAHYIAHKVSHAMGGSVTERAITSSLSLIKKSDLGKFLMKFYDKDKRGHRIRLYRFRDGARTLKFKQAVSLYRKTDKSITFANCSKVFPFLKDDYDAITAQTDLPLEDSPEKKANKALKISYIKSVLTGALHALEEVGYAGMEFDEGARLMAEIYAKARKIFDSESSALKGEMFAVSWIDYLADGMESAVNYHPGSEPVRDAIFRLRDTIDRLFGNYYREDPIDDSKIGAGSGPGLSFAEVIERYLPKLSSETRKDIFKALSGLTSGAEIGDNKTFVISPKIIFNFGGKLPDIHLDGEHKDRIINALRLILHGVDVE